MRMVRASSILTWIEMKQYRTLEASEYIEWDYERENLNEYKLLCVSHRWITIDHPDPKSNQLRELQQRLNTLFEIEMPILSCPKCSEIMPSSANFCGKCGQPMKHQKGMEAAFAVPHEKSFAAQKQQDNNLDTYLVFYDYCSMPQNPRTAEEDVLFLKDISALNTLFLSANKTIILSEGYSDYKNRAWCFFELIISKQNLYLFKDQKNIEDDLEFMDHMPIEFPGVRLSLTSYDFEYKIDLNAAEIIIAIFQHLTTCKVTNSSDFPLIKRQMVAYFNSRRTSSFGKALIALNKYFDLMFTALLRDETHFACKPYFEQPTWIRLPSLGRGFFASGSMQKSVFALPQAEFEAIKRVGRAYATVRLSMQGIDDLIAFMKKYQQDEDWKLYIVEPMLIGQQNKDFFPSMSYIIHTILERFPPLFGYEQESQYMYFSLPAEEVYSDGLFGLDSDSV